jgi:hypothetical protein
MRLSAVIAWLLGLGLLAALVALHDPAEILQAVAALKAWLLLIIAFHAVPVWLDIVAWQRRFTAPPPLLGLFRIRWIAEGVNGLLPVPHPGELLRADLARRISRRGEAGPSVVVDITLGVATQVLFAAFGLALFALIAGASLVLRARPLATAVLAIGLATF